MIDNKFMLYVTIDALSITILELQEKLDTIFFFFITLI